jgi:hypothetical protein
MGALSRIVAHREYHHTLEKSEYKGGFAKIFNTGVKNGRRNKFRKAYCFTACLLGFTVALVGAIHHSSVLLVAGFTAEVFFCGGVIFYSINEERNRKKYADKLDAFKATHQIELKPLGDLPPVVADTIAATAA